MQMVEIDPARLHVAPGNPRRHPPAQIEKLSRSIERFGFMAPVLALPSGEIIAGEARWRAAIAAKRASIRVVWCALSASEAAAYRVADNRLALDADWDEALLAAVLAELAAIEFPAIDLGFDTAEIERLLPSLDDVAIDLPALKSGDRASFQAMTFTLADAQAATVRRAMELARQQGPYDQAVNKNANGNAIARVCAAFVAAQS